MTTSTQIHHHLEVPIYVFDLTESTTHEPGFYYTIGLDEEGKKIELNHGQRLHLRGPFSTHDDARAGAIDFVEDVNTDLTAAEANFQFVDEEEENAQ